MSHLRSVIFRASFFVSVLITFASGILSPVYAQSGDNIYAGLHSFGELLLPEGSQLTVGAGLSYGPDYFGSNDYSLEPDPVLFLRLGKILTLSNDGAAFNILGLKDFKFGPVVHFTGGRNQNTNPILDGLGDVGDSLDLGVFAKATIADRFIARLRYYHAVAGGSNGGAADLTFSTLLYETEKLSVALGARARWGDSQHTRQFFGISASQSTASGLPVFRPGSSVQDVRIGIGARWELSEEWSLNGYARYTRLIGEIDTSPLVDPFGSPNQLIVGTFLSHTIDF